MGAGRKRKAAPWDTVKGWQQVKVGDDIMLGSTESGFMGLEILDPAATTLLGNTKMPAAQADNDADLDIIDAELDAQPATDIPDTSEQQKPKRAKTADKSAAKSKEKASAVKPADLAALTAKVAALEAENSALKAERQPASQKSAKKSKGAKAASETPVLPATSDAEPIASTETIDLSPWSQFEFLPKILQAIAEAGFSNPTPIQEQCLLPAIRDRRDVIGAAQTVSMDSHIRHLATQEIYTRP